MSGDRPQTKQDVELSLDPFVFATVEEEAVRRDLTVSELIALAAEYHLADRETPRPSHRLPLAYLALEDEDGMRLDVELRAEAWELLTLLAVEEQTSPELLLQHAALQLVADLDSGRVTTRVTG
jgi:hypothetical protein